MSRVEARSAPLPPETGLAHLRGRFLLIATVMVLALLLALYLTDLLPERWAGLLLGTGVVLGAGALIAGAFLSSALGAADNAVAVGLAVAVALAAGAPIIRGLFPGAPVADRTLTAEGDSLALPSVHGPVRVLAQTHAAAAELYRCHAELAIGNALVPLDLGREPESVRLGRRGRGTVLRDHASAYATGTLAAGADSIRLARLDGSKSCALELSVFEDRLTFGLRIGLGAALMVLAAIAAARMRAGALPVVLTGMAFGFSLFAAGVLTPRAAVRPEIGALLAGLPLGAAAAAISAWIVRRLVPARARR